MTNCQEHSRAAIETIKYDVTGVSKGDEQLPELGRQMLRAPANFGIPAK
jgi:hypothetical protein